MLTLNVIDNASNICLYLFFKIRRLISSQRNHMHQHMYESTTTGADWGYKKKTCLLVVVVLQSTIIFEKCTALWQLDFVDIRSGMLERNFRRQTPSFPPPPPPPKQLQTCCTVISVISYKYLNHCRVCGVL